jgi:hypothetical protein
MPCDPGPAGIARLVRSANQRVTRYVVVAASGQAGGQAEEHDHSAKAHAAPD